MKSLGIVAIALMWLGTLLLLHAHGAEHKKSISRHAAKNSKFHLTYGLLEVLVASLFTIFILRWFIPKFHLPVLASIAAIIGFAGTVFAALVPDRIGWQQRVHETAAYSMVLCLPVLSAIILLSRLVNFEAKVTAAVVVVYTIFGLASSVFCRAWYRRHMLVLQTVYFAFFHATILAATYLPLH